MPCQSDYMAASGHELESQRVCGLITCLWDKMGKDVPEWIVKAAGDYYGNVSRLDEATRILCETFRGLTTPQTEQFVYNAHDKESRKLADWWERHQEWDVRRKAEEEASRRKIMLKDRAIQKLTVEEREALGL